MSIRALNLARRSLPRIGVGQQGNIKECVKECLSKEHVRGGVARG